MATNSNKVDEFKKRLDILYKQQAQIIEDIHSDLTGKEVDELSVFIANHPHNKFLNKTANASKNIENPGIK